MPALPTYTPPPMPPPGPRPVQAPDEADSYKTFVIKSPVNEETVRNNLGILNIETILTPALQTRLNHRVQYFLNGKPYGTPVGKTSLTINNLDRGEYTLSASVVDANGKTLISTDSVVLFIKRNSILTNPTQSKPAASR
jgi:hypothetical protein